MKKILSSIIALAVLAGVAVAQEGFSTNTAVYTKEKPILSTGLPELAERKTAGWYVGTYDYALDGGAVGDIALDCVVPDNFIVYDGLIEVVTPVTPVTNMCSLKLNAAGDILAASTNLSATLVDTIPVGTAATAVKMTADRTLTVTFTSAATAGKFRVWLYGHQGL